MIVVVYSINVYTINIFIRCFFFLLIRPPTRSTLFPYTTLFRSSTVDIFTFYVPHRHVYGEQWIKFMKDGVGKECRSEERFSRNAETDLVCRLLLEKKKKKNIHCPHDCINVAPQYSDNTVITPKHS